MSKNFKAQIWYAFVSTDFDKLCPIFNQIGDISGLPAAATRDRDPGGPRRPGGSDLLVMRPRTAGVSRTQKVAGQPSHLLSANPKPTSRIGESLVNICGACRVIRRRLGLGAWPGRRGVRVRVDVRNRDLRVTESVLAVRSSAWAAH